MTTSSVTSQALPTTAGGFSRPRPGLPDKAGDREPAGHRTVVLTGRGVLLAVSAALTFALLYQDRGVWLFGLVAVCAGLPVVLAAFRVREARRRGITLELLRHPLHSTVRGHLLQVVNIWVLCLLLAGVLAAGGADAGRILFALTSSQFDIARPALDLGLVVLAALALVPRRRIDVAANLVVALLSGFLALQLVQMSVAQPNPTVLDSPFAESWYVYNGGRGVLFNGHSPNESHAVDFMRLTENGKTHAGGSDAPLRDYAGFGTTVHSPVAGRVVEVTEGFPDNPPGTNGDYANHLVIDIGNGRYVAMAHLKQGSVTVKVGDRVRRGQPLAAVGNNGHSNEPHLHLQVQDSPAGMQANRTSPMVFRNVQITRGGAWPWGDRRELRTGDLIRPIK
jgi:murein DD-endopeptidase MepM/ murein hydrolase activator NlpD